MIAPGRIGGSNLPPTPSSFVGRTALMAELVRRLDSGRLVTLLGPGGAGKTRLAIETAARMRGLYGDGVWLVHLDAVSNPQLVPVDIGRVVGMRQDPERHSTDTLAEHLASRRVLIVLDNCEHVAASVAKTVDAVLERAPNVHVLATSQVPLHAEAERVIDVPPLQLPDTPLPDSEQLAQVPAVRLFLDRAESAEWTEDAADPDTLRAVADLVTRLDGLPLAIELAAARTRDTSLPEISAGLSHPFEVLNRGRRTTQPHQLTLQAVVEWTLGLLDLSLRTVVTRLSVFVGGFDIASAARVLGDEEVETEAAIETLADRALLRRLPDAVGLPRFAMPGGLRIYAAELLEDSGEAVEVRCRHLDHFTSFARTADRGLRGPDQLDWLVRFDVDHDNIRSALRWSIDERKIEGAVRLAAAMGRFWDWRGHLKGGADWTIRLAEIAGDQPVPGIVSLLMWQSFFEWEMGERERARRAAAMATLAANRSSEPLDPALALVAPSLIARAEGRLQDAEAANAEILRIAGKFGDRWLEAWGSKNAAIIAVAQGHLDAAETEARRAVSRFRAYGDRRGVAWGEIALAEVARARGDAEGACELCRRALSFVEQAEDLQDITWILETLAALAYEAEDLARAAMLLGAAHPLHTMRGLDRTPPKLALSDTLQDLLMAALGDGFLEPFRRGQRDPDRVVRTEVAALNQ